MSYDDPNVDWEPRVVLFDADGKPFRRALGFAPTPRINDMSQTTGTFPALTDNVRKPKPKVTPLDLRKILAPPTPKKK